MPGVVQNVPRSRPSRPKMPRMSACVVAPLMCASAPQLYSVMPISQPRIVGVHPLLHARDEPHAVGDPGLVHVARIPERARRAVAARLHRARRVAAELPALRVEVERQHVQQAVAGRLLVLAHLREQPRNVVAVRVAFRRAVPAAVLLAPLEVVARVEVARPAPLLGPGEHGAGIDLADRRPVRDPEVPQLGHALALRVDVAVRRVPDARLVVVEVVAHAAAVGRAPARHQVLGPFPHVLRVHRDVRVVRVVARHERAVRPHAVARVREPLPVAVLLRPVLRGGEARELARRRVRSCPPSRSAGS